jgi:hypothetical protein
MVKYLLCTAGGVAIGYYFAHARLEQEFHNRLERESDEVRAFYRRKYLKKAKEEGEDEGLTQSAVDAAEALLKYDGISVGPDILTQEMSATVQRAVDRGELDAEVPAEVEAEKTVVNSPLAETKAKHPVVNYNRISTPTTSVEETKAPETSTATESKPEVQVDIITKKSFIDNEFGYEQFSLTYFAGDDVITNEEDEPMKGNRSHMFGREVVKKIMVGREAMDGSDTIFVRNHNGKWDFEITRSEGKFSDEVGAETG